MVHDVIGEIKKFHDLNELSSAAAQDISILINKVVSSRGAFFIALSGGNTPQNVVSNSSEQLMANQSRGNPFIFSFVMSALFPTMTLEVTFSDG